MFSVADRDRVCQRVFERASSDDRVVAGATIYRVFLLPGCLQLDLSFTREREFGAAAPTFQLRFGRAA
jgi:hypothetical protein